jgi:hypothetical protein
LTPISDTVRSHHHLHLQLHIVAFVLTSLLLVGYLVFMWRPFLKVWVGYVKVAVVTLYAADSIQGAEGHKSTGSSTNRSRRLHTQAV